MIDYKPEQPPQEKLVAIKTETAGGNNELVETMKSNSRLSKDRGGVQHIFGNPVF